MSSCKHGIDRDLDCDNCEDEAEAARSARRPPLGNHPVVYKCTDCGHEQTVTEIHTEHGVYVGSGANWCDACGDGKPERKEAP